MIIQKFIKTVRATLPTLPFRRNDSHFKPTFYLRHHSLQSIYELMSPDVDFQFKRQKIFFIDGGHVSLDWANKERADAGRPIVLIMHGMTGGTETKYMKILSKTGCDNDYCVVCLNSRGINSEMTSPIPFVGLYFHQLEATISRIQAMYPDNHLYLLGTSLGGNYLLRYLLDHKVKNLKGLALLCPPFDVKYVIETMNILYQKAFIKYYINNTIMRHEQMSFWWKTGIIDLDYLKESKDMKEFHNRITIQLTGFDHCDQVFDHMKVDDQKLKNFDVKTFILTARDDPMVEYTSFPHGIIANNPNLELMTTQRGGHLCWFSGMIPQRWFPKPIFDFINKIQKQTP